MSKVNMMSAKDKKKDSQVPRLRFSEFIGDREWDCAQMGDIYAFKKNNSFSRDMLNYNAGDVKNIHYGDIHKKFSSHFYAENENIPFVNCNINLGNISEDCLCTAGDIIFADASEDIKDIGKCIEIISNNKERILSGLHTIFTRQFSSTLVIGFGGYLFQSPRVRAQIQKEAQGTKILGISSGRLAKISISFPFAKGEQQKIADCLSSLDERIAAETNKLDALKAHKKGLLKQLFPAEGETLPQLRFPEFWDAGEWEWKKLKNVCEINPSSETLPQTFIYIDLESVSAGKLLSKKTILLEEAPSRAQRLLKNGDIIFQMVRPYQKNNLYCNFNDNKNYVASTGYALLRALEDNIFLYQAIHCDTFVDSVISKCTGSNYPAINSSDLSGLIISTPSLQEQQRIAGCLSSLDELITAQTQKIDLLKDHKKGLMQQLFPCIDEVRA